MTRKHKLMTMAALVFVAAALTIAIYVPQEVFGGSQPSIVIQSTVELVPPGQVVRITHTTDSGQLTDWYLVDPHDRRCVHVIAESACPPFCALLVFDDSGRSSLSGLTLEVREDSGLDTPAADDYEEAVSRLDTLAGQTLEQLGVEEVNGELTWVVKGEKTVTGDSGDRTLYVTGYVDPSTGLVVREEVSDGSEEFLVTRELGYASSWQYGEIGRSDLGTVAASIRTERIDAMSDLPWATFALPEGENGLSLMWLAPSVDSDYCRLEYESSVAPGEGAVSVVLRNLKAHPDYPLELLQPLADARVEGSNDFQRISFRLGDTAVQVLVVNRYTELSARDWAGQLLPLEDAGLR